MDAVLLIHNQHGDDLDTAGRVLLPSIGAAVTTVARLGGSRGRPAGSGCGQHRAGGAGQAGHEGWTHFNEGRVAAERAFAAAERAFAAAERARPTTLRVSGLPPVG